MITSKRLKELLAQVPDEAQISAYEGERTGLNVYLPGHAFPMWFISASDCDEEETYTEGFPELRADPA